MATATQTPFVTMSPATQPARLPMPTTPTAGQPVRRWPLTVDDYHRLAEIGVFAPEESVELIDGDVFLLSPIRSRHAACVRRLDDRLRERLGRRAIVSVQCPVRLDARSEPEPDLALLRSRADYYADGHPSAADTLLLIEVMAAAPDYDRGVKLALYARSGVAEVWLVDLASERVEAYRRPMGALYTETRIHLRGQVLAPQSFPDVKLGVDAVLG
jgi:Uma2 family endonuclease